MRFVIVVICVLGLFLSMTAPACAQKSRAGNPADKPVVNNYTSPNFLLHTDLDPDAAKALLERLETMLKLISAYWGQPNRQQIEMFVAEDIDSWPQTVLQHMDPDGIQSIRNGAGVTASRSRYSGNRRQTKSMVYAVSKRGTPQHEAVHAYCQQTFGTTGPLWYSEGMAEMGQYWRKDDPGVNCSTYIVKYLQTTEIKSLNEIVNPETEVTGDSWQNYAWRWALCHLLANNTNYAQRFRPLGLGMLAKQQISFEQTYGSMSEEIVFEYRLFIEDLAVGYRADLCSWDWKSKFAPPVRGRIAKAVIQANKGWQATRVQVESGQKYDFAVDGTWQTDASSEPQPPHGSEKPPHTGRLVGVIFKDYKLSEPFSLGQHGSFTAESDGKLFVRCRDDWGSLADNKGSVTLRLRLHDTDTPLAPPVVELASSTEMPDDSEPGKSGGDEAAANEKRANSKLRLGKLLLKRSALKARPYFREVIELAPDSKAATEARQLLEEN